jgi:hypothetical protein
MKSSCEFGNEPSGSIKCWETICVLTTGGLSCSVQLYKVSKLVSTRWRSWLRHYSAIPMNTIYETILPSFILYCSNCRNMFRSY